MIRSVDHIQFTVTDVEKFVDFFQKLGFQVVTRTSHHGGSAELQLPGPNQPVFEIHKATRLEQIGLSHIALQVSNAQEAYEELKDKGIDFGEEVPRLVEVTGRTMVDFRDPDGWRLQLAEAERKTPQ